MPLPWFSKSRSSLCRSTTTLVVPSVAGSSTSTSPPWNVEPVCGHDVCVSSPGRRGVTKRDTYSRAPSAFSDRCRGVGPTKRTADLGARRRVELEHPPGAFERDEGRAAVRREHEAVRLRPVRQRDRPAHAERGGIDHA